MEPLRFVISTRKLKNNYIVSAQEQGSEFIDDYFVDKSLLKCQLAFLKLLKNLDERIFTVIERGYQGENSSYAVVEIDPTLRAYWGNDDE